MEYTRKTASEICELYLGVSLVTARKKPDHMYKLVNILIEVKGWSVNKVADKLNSRTDTIERYKRKKKKMSDIIRRNAETNV